MPHATSFASSPPAVALHDLHRLGAGRIDAVLHDALSEVVLRAEEASTVVADVQHGQPLAEARHLLFSELYMMGPPLSELQSGV